MASSAPASIVTVWILPRAQVSRGVIVSSVAVASQSNDTDVAGSMRTRRSTLAVFIASGKLIRTGADGDSPVSTIGVNSAGSIAEIRAGSVPVAGVGRRAVAMSTPIRPRATNAMTAWRRLARRTMVPAYTRTRIGTARMVARTFCNTDSLLARSLGTAASCGCRLHGRSRRQDSTMCPSCRHTCCPPRGREPAAHPDVAEFVGLPTRALRARSTGCDRRTVDPERVAAVGADDDAPAFKDRQTREDRPDRQPRDGGQLIGRGRAGGQGTNQ